MPFHCRPRFLLTVLLVLPLLPLVAACPTEVCVCKWKNGKQTAECSNRQLTDIPDGLDTGTQVLNFTGNGLTYLKAEWFYHMNLINLQKIFLMRNEIARIHSRAFHGLSNLVELDLSDNQLTAVPSDSFADYGSLMRLALNGNPIRALRSAAFKHLPYLTTLELTNCQIEVVESEAFIGMDNLEWLRLDGNRITTIRGAHLLPDSLHGISLQGNRWTCDCAMVDLHRWLATSTVPQTEEPKCAQPTRLAGSTIRSVDRGQLACLPEITPANLSLEIAEYRNLTLTCKVEASPAATISWWFQGRALENHTVIGTNIHLLMTFTMEPEEPEKRIDLFISNTTAETNGTFVCTAENAAGRVQANYTVRVLSREEPVVEQVRFPFEYYLMFVAGAAGIGIIVLIIVCIVIVKCCCQRRRRNGGRGADENGGASDAANGHWAKKKKAHLAANGDVQNNGGSGVGGGVAGNVTLITDKVMVGAGGGQAAINGGGGGFGYGVAANNKQDVIMYVSGGLAENAPSAAADLQQQQQQQHMMGNRLATVSSASPPHLLGSNNTSSGNARNYSPDPINPDLINDTEKQRLVTASSVPVNCANNPSSSANQALFSGGAVKSNAFCDETGKLREFVSSQSYTRPPHDHPMMASGTSAHLGTLPRTRHVSGDLQLPPPQQQQPFLHPHHHHQADVHLNPSCFLVAQHQQQQPQSLPLSGAEHAVEYRQLVASGQGIATPSAAVNFAYRTLPHRMKLRNGAQSPTGAADDCTPPTLRFSRDAEFLTLPPQAFDLYQGAAAVAGVPNFRYTAEGYPYQPPFMPHSLSPGSTTIATTSTQQVQVAFQPSPVDAAIPVQFLPSPPEGYKSTSTNTTPATSTTAQEAIEGAQWPPCLPASQIIPIKTNFAQRFASPLASPASSVTSSTSSSKLSTSTTQSSSGSAGSNSTTSVAGSNQLPLHTPPPPVITKRCVGAQTMLCETGGGGSSEGGCPAVGRRIGLLATTTSTLNDVDETEEEEEEDGEEAEGKGTRSCRHLNGPLADSPDEGYVGDSGHDGSSD